MSNSESAARLGACVTMSRREHPEDGVDWYAPYEVRCEVHGRVLARRTAFRARIDGREHVREEHDGE